MNYLIVGYKGRLGGSIFGLINRKENVVYGVDKGDDIYKFKSEKVDVIIDVSTALNSERSLQFAVKKKIPIIIGCTGHNAKQIESIKKAGEKTAVLLCYNFSVGVFALKKALAEVLKFKPIDAYITEYHHKNKLDKPSGTAIELEKQIMKSDCKLHETVSVRQNSFVGKHIIELYFEGEHICLSHTAEDRNCFAMGALKAAKKMVNLEKGFYHFDDLFN